MIIAIFLVILIFGLLVFIHELGHFTAARLGGVEVEEFGFGFPPRAVGKKVGKTIYSLNWLPIGGFVRLKGEDSADRSLGSYNIAGFRKKLAILIAGVIMNLLAAYVLLVILCFNGLPASVAKVLSVARPAHEQAPNVLVLGVTKDSPAAQAGIKVGESIVSLNGVTMHDEQDLIATTKRLAGTKISLVVNNQGSKRVVNVQLRDAAAGKDRGYLGVSPFETHTVRYGSRSPLVAASMTSSMIISTLKGFILGIAGLLHLIKPSVEVAVTGPVGIVVLLSNVMRLGAGYILFFVATISASLAVVNILPLPALDGGRVFLLLVERLSGRKLTPEREALVHTIGFVALIALMIIITVFDVRRIIH